MRKLASAKERDAPRSARQPLERSRTRLGFYWANHWQYYLLLLLPLLYFIVFRYGPIAGNLLAFRKIVPGGSLLGQKWVGLHYFKLFMLDPNFWHVFRNTWTLSLLHLLIAFPLTLIFALLVNEFGRKLRSLIQLVSSFPNFVSVVIVVGMMKELLSPSGGIVNGWLEQLGIAPIFFMNEPGWFRTLFIGSDIWQYTGWNAIIYLAALSTVDPHLYEAAEMDGAGRLSQTWHVTLPQIMPTVSVVFILSLGQLLNVGYEKVLLMYTPSNSQTSDIIDTYIYRMGLESNNYSYATAIGLVAGLASLALVLGTNALVRRLTGHSLY